MIFSRNWLLTRTRVAPVIKEAVESGRINFTSIVNTHQ